MNHQSLNIMKKIGLLSDTHGYFDENMRHFLEPVDEIWHAGDIGTLQLLDELKEIKPLRAVYGNIDGHDIRNECEDILIFSIEKVKVVMLHVGGNPGRYEFGVKNILLAEKPQLFISGHSHILKVIFDKNYNLLYINPGAAGIQGFHKFRTMVRFIIDNDKIKDLEIWEHNR